MPIYGGFSREGTYDEAALLVGSWSEVIAEKSGNHYHVGNVKDGVLEIGREYYEHVSSAFPRKTDLVVATRVWMKFTGVVEEIHRQNVSWLSGRALNPTSDYIYVGILSTSYYFTFHGRRVRISDGVNIEFRMHKCMTRNLFSLGSGDEAMGSPLEVEGLDDTEGGYGGSAASPIGWIWVPAKSGGTP
jgi:hypothetical protein